METTEEHMNMLFHLQLFTPSSAKVFVVLAVCVLLFCIFGWQGWFFSTLLSLLLLLVELV